MFARILTNAHAENRTLTMLNEKVLNTLKQAPHRMRRPAHNKGITYILKHFFGIALGVDTNISSWVKRKVRELNRFAGKKIKTGKGFPQQEL